MIKRSSYFTVFLLAHTAFADNKWIIYGAGPIGTVAFLLIADYYSYKFTDNFIDGVRAVPYYATHRYAEEITPANKQYTTIIDDVVMTYYKNKNSQLLLGAIDALSQGCNGLHGITNQKLEDIRCGIKISEAETLLAMHKEQQPADA